MATSIWTELGFKKNPFNIVPDTESNDLIWAGFNSTKLEFEKLMRTCLTTDETKVLINLSRYGGGKTHAAYYFAKHSATYTPAGAIPPLHFVITAPKIGDNAVWDFYVKLIEAMSFTSIKASLRSHRAALGAEDALKELQALAKSEDVGRLIWLLADTDDDIAHFAGDVLMSGKASAPIRRKLRLRRGLESNSDASLVLGTLLNVLARYDGNAGLTKARRVFVWLDEVEALVFYSSRHYRPFTQAIRELIDCTPKYLALVMNFSFAAPREAENLEIVIGEALLDRVTDRIVFEEGSVEESLQYLNDLLSHYRVNKDVEPISFPLSNEAALKLLETAPARSGKPRTPRRINQWCVQAIEAAHAKGAIPATGIDAAFVDNLSFAADDGEGSSSIS